MSDGFVGNEYSSIRALEFGFRLLFSEREVYEGVFLEGVRFRFGEIRLEVVIGFLG